MYSYDILLANLAKTVRASYPRQVLAPGRYDDGAFISPAWGMPSADHASNGVALARACWAYLAEGSDLRGDAGLFDRILRSIAFQRRMQRETGLIDLPLVNLHSPPDTGFTVEFFCPIVEVARRMAAAGNAGAAEIAEKLGEYVRTAAAGMVERGFHTPNHRWLVVSALAMAMKLYPEIDAAAYANRILAETIDMNEDGEYSERSNVVYNSVCNRALLFIADYFGRPDMLDLVRRNLGMMVRMFNPDGSIYTGVSKRQDRGQKAIPNGADVFFELAARDGNPVWATVADMLATDAVAKNAVLWEIVPFMLHPARRTEILRREPIPDELDAYLPSSKIWRKKRGPLTVTAAAGTTGPFELKYGEAHLKGVKISANWFHIGLFVPTTMERTADGVRMTYVTKSHGRPAYDMPLGRPVAWDGWGATFHERDFWELEPFVMTLDVREVRNGFDLRFHTDGGLDRVMFDVECYFATPGEWETDAEIVRAESGGTVILKSGYGVFRCGDDAISVGPGIAEHRMGQMRGMDGAGPSFRVRLTPLSPVNHTLEIRYGAWSVTNGEVVGPE